MQPMRRKRTFWLIVQKNLWAMGLRSFLRYLLVVCMAWASVWVYAAEPVINAGTKTNAAIYPSKIEKQRNIDLILEEIKECKTPQYKIKSLIYFSDFILSFGHKNLFEEHGIYKDIKLDEEVNKTTNFIRSIKQGDLTFFDINGTAIEHYGSTFKEYNNQFTDNTIKITCYNKQFQLSFYSRTYFLKNIDYELIGGDIASGSNKYSFHTRISTIDNLMKLILDVFDKEEVYDFYIKNDNFVKLSRAIIW